MIPWADLRLNVAMILLGYAAAIGYRYWEVGYVAF